MVVIDSPAPVGLLLAAGELSMPFSDTVKYCILGISVALFLLALGILAWQAYRCCTQRHTIYTQEDSGSSDLLYLDKRSTTTGNYLKAAGVKAEDGFTEVGRLSHCPSQTMFPSSRSSQAYGDIREPANIKKVSGSLHFSLYYDQLQSQLVVTVLQVEGFLEHSQTHSLQLFVKLRLMWSDSEGAEVEDGLNEEGDGAVPVLWTVLQEWQTRIVKGSCNPLFGDQFSCVLQEEKELHDINLRMEVRDFDKFSRHTVLGEVRVPLRQLNISYPLELQEDLRIPRKDLVGEVLISLKVLPTSQRLEIGLLKVRTVLNKTFSDAVLYARISVQCNQCKLRYQKTSAVAHCQMTVFNEVLIFSLPAFPLDQCKILFSVYETQSTRKSNKHLIGQLSVGKGKSSEDNHWSLMMRSVRHPIAKWHGLHI